MNQVEFIAKWAPIFKAEVQYINYASVVHDKRTILSQDDPWVPVQRTQYEEIEVDEQTMRELHGDAQALLSVAGQDVGQAAALLQHIARILCQDSPQQRVARAIFGALDRRHYGEDTGILALGSTGQPWEDEE